MGLLSGVVSLLSGRPSKNDRLTLLPFYQWVAGYRDAGPLSSSGMASALFFQGADYLVSQVSSEYRPIHNVIMKKNRSSVTIMDKVILPMVVKAGKDDSFLNDFDYEKVLHMPANMAMAYILSAIYDTYPDLFMDAFMG